MRAVTQLTGASPTQLEAALAALEAEEARLAAWEAALAEGKQPVPVQREVAA